MSDLFTRLAEQHAHGHARADIALHVDTRIPGSADDFRPAAVLAAITEREQPGVRQRGPQEIRQPARQFVVIDPVRPRGTRLLRFGAEQKVRGCQNRRQRRPQGGREILPRPPPLLVPAEQSVHFLRRRGPPITVPRQLVQYPARGRFVLPPPARSRRQPSARTPLPPPSNPLYPSPARLNLHTAAMPAFASPTPSGAALADLSAAANELLALDDAAAAPGVDYALDLQGAVRG